MASFSVRTLGFPEIRWDDRLCPLALRKGLALLVYLAEAKGSVGRDVIATMLWPESPADVVRARLRRLLHRLQLALGDESSHPTDRRFGCRQRSICRSIHASSSRPATAASSSAPAALYQADFLDGFSPGDCPQFDEWAFFRREALRGRAIQALERVVHEKHAAGDYASAAAHAGRLVELDPLSEIYGRHLIRNLLLGGDRAAAERQLEALTQRLRDELDVAPEAETSALLKPMPTDAAADPLCQRRRRASRIPDLWHRAHRYSDAARLRVPCRTGLGGRPGAGRSCPRWRRWAVSSCSIAVASAFPTGSGSAPAQRRPRRTSAPCLMPPAPAGSCCSARPRADRPASSSRPIIPIASRASSCSPRSRKEALHPTIRTRCTPISMMRGCSSSFRPGAGLPASRRSRRVSPAIPKARAWWAGLLRAASSPGAIKGVLEALRDTDVRHLLEPGFRSDAGAPPPRRPRRSHRRRKTSCRPHPAGALHRARRRRSLGLRR